MDFEKPNLDNRKNEQTKGHLMYTYSYIHIEDEGTSPTSSSFKNSSTVLLKIEKIRK